MNINEVPAYSSNTLKAQDLGDTEFPLTITGYEIRDVGGKGVSKDTKAVLSFKEAKKGFVLNKTNANTISSMYGPEMENWKGKKIVLYASQTDYSGKQVPCIRVKLPVGTIMNPVLAAMTPAALPGEPSSDESPMVQDVPF